MQRIWLPLLLFCLLAAMPAGAASNEPGTPEILGDGPARLNVGVGFFNVADGGNTPAAARIEWRFGRKFYRLAPLLGVLVNADEGIFTYGGLHLEIAWRQLVFTPQGGIGAYCRGDGKDLGGTLEFRTALELAWQSSGGYRLGAQAGHISNAHLHRRNGGENDLFLTFSLPF